MDGRVRISMFLKDPVNNEAYRRFLEREHCDEMLRFYMAVENFRELQDEKDLGRARHRIFNTFFRDGVPGEVNVSDGIRVAIVSKMDHCPIDKHMFDDAQQEVMTTMKHGTFSRFLQSIFYELLMRGLECKALVVNPVVLHTFVELCKSDHPKAWKRKKKTSQSLGYECFEWAEVLGEGVEGIIKCRCDFECAGAIVHHVVSDCQQRLRYDDTLGRVDILHQFDPQFRVMQLHYKSPTIFARNRDAVVGMLTCSSEKDSQLFCIVRSVPWQDNLLIAPSPPITTSSSSLSSGSDHTSMSSSPPSSSSSSSLISQSFERKSPRSPRLGQQQQQQQASSLPPPGVSTGLRMDVECSGFLITCTAEKKCQVTYLVQVNFGGIPKLIQKMAIRTRLEVLQKLKMYMMSTHLLTE